MERERMHAYVSSFPLRFGQKFTHRNYNIKQAAVLFPFYSETQEL